MNMNPENPMNDPYQDLAQFFKQLSHPVRLEILTELQKGEACVCHLEAVTGQRQAYLSQQLAGLKSAGLIEDRKEGWNVYYRLSSERIVHLLDDSAAFIAPAGLIALKTPVDCPCPKCRAKKENHQEE